MASRSDGFWRRARCSSSTASAPWPTAVWASARVLQAPVKVGSISSARWIGAMASVRPAGKVQHEAQHVLQHGALGRELQRLPGLGDRLLVVAEPAQRQRAVAQDLAAAGGIVAGIDHGHVEHLDRRLVVAQAIKRVAQHVARPRLQGLQAFACPAAFFHRLVDVAHELAELALGGGEAAHGPYGWRPAPAAPRHGPARGGWCRGSAAPPRRDGPAGAPPGRDCRTASARWGPWRSPCATCPRRRRARRAAPGRRRGSAGCRAARRGVPGPSGTAARHDRTSRPSDIAGRSADRDRVAAESARGVGAPEPWRAV